MRTKTFGPFLVTESAMDKHASVTVLDENGREAVVLLCKSFEIAERRARVLAFMAENPGEYDEHA